VTFQDYLNIAYPIVLAGVTFVFGKLHINNAKAAAAVAADVVQLGADVAGSLGTHTSAIASLRVAVGQTSLVPVPGKQLFTSKER
jgi:hypothetical protein